MPEDGNDVPRIAVDLTNREETVAALSGLSDVTHIFYEARFDHPEGEYESIETNTAMFRNLIDATVPLARHLAKATVWMATEAACANQDFNITNGDLFRWKNLCPKFARYFALEPGPVETVDLSDYMSGKEPYGVASSRNTVLLKSRSTRSRYEDTSTTFGRRTGISSRR